MDSVSCRTAIRMPYSSAHYLFFTDEEEKNPFISIHKGKKLNFVNRNEIQIELDVNSMEVLIKKRN